LSNSPTVMKKKFRDMFPHLPIKESDPSALTEEDLTQDEYAPVEGERVWVRSKDGGETLILKQYYKPKNK
jgi:hypothetical protein